MEATGLGDTREVGNKTVQEEDVTSKSPEDDHRKLKQFTAMSFVVLILSSMTTSVVCIAFWLNLNELEQLTNTFSAFFGFLTASLISLVAGICGMFEVYETPNIESHSMAVVWLLISSITVNIVFPTTALLPIGVDNSKRIPTMSLQECIPESDLPECLDADNLRTVLYCMYIPILLELAVLIFYYILWTRRNISMTSEQSEVPALSQVLTDEKEFTDPCDTIRLRGTIDETAASFSEFY